MAGAGDGGGGNGDGEGALHSVAQNDPGRPVWDVLRMEQGRREGLAWSQIVHVLPLTCWVTSGSLLSPTEPQ